MNEPFMQDFYRRTSTQWSIGGVRLLIKQSELRFLFVLRKAEISKSPLWRFMLRRMRMKYGLDISPKVKIGEGLYLNHPYCIAVNDRSVLGKNINITKGVTIGATQRGDRKGAPIIGNRVWIGANATIVGAVTIGEDVLIAPNAFVNFDVPQHSIVIGNPGKIIPKENATEGYVNDLV